MTPNDEKYALQSFCCTVIAKADDIYLYGPAPLMFSFFGTSAESYKEGIIARIARDISSESAEKLRTAFSENAGKGENFRLTYPSKRADGSPCTVQFEAFAGNTVQDGRLYTGIGTDISRFIDAQKKADAFAVEIQKKEKELKKQYETAQSMVNSMTENFLVAMRIDVSKNTAEITGGSYKLFAQQTLPAYDTVVQYLTEHFVIRIKDKEEFRNRFCSKHLLEAYCSGSKTVSYTYLFSPPQGRCIWVATEITLAEDPESGDIIGFGAVRDTNKSITKEKIMDDILIHQYDFISCIDGLGGTIKLISVNKENGLIQKLNPFMYSDSAENYIRNYVVPDEKEACRRFMALPNIIKELDAHGSCRASFTVNEDGTPRSKRLDYHYLDREVKLIVFIRTDITDLQHTQMLQEDRLRTALAAAQQANTAKSSFLSRMSHEIRTPLNAIIGMDTLAAQAIGDDEKITDCISKIGLSAHYLLSLINDILDMSRIESGKMLLKNDRFQFRDFIESINTIIYNQAAAKGLDYECIVSNEVEASFIGDAMKLQQILINVLGNAVKYTQRGRICLEVQRISGNSGTTLLRFIISDTGCGIREEDQQRIFEPFEQADTSNTTTFSGTGLGLAITKNLVTLMGGTIRLRSIVDVGSEFTVEIPLTIDESTPVKPKYEYHFEKLHTLVVDDDVSVCEQTASILKDIGMTGEWVASGHEAVEKVKHNAEKSLFFDFILIDWKMPNMNGIETTRRIRQIVGPDVTIIIISAYDWQSISSEAHKAGADMLISKPLLKSTLLEAFRKSKGKNEDIQQTAADFDFTGKRILLAEDNQINAEIAEALLKQKHFTVDHADNGLHALEKFTQSPVGYYDAILMDIRMPVMDGLQAAVNIRHWNKEDAKTIPIIAMTANAFDEDIDKSKAAGMNAHLSKPIEPDILYRTLYRILEDA